MPLLVYVKGRPDQSTYIGHGMESYEKELGKFWTPAFQASSTSLDSAQLAVDHLRKLAPGVKRVGVERAFLPADAAELMTRELPGITFVEAHMPLERLRARKTKEELDLLRAASELVVDSMLAVIASHGPGATKAEVVEALRREEVNRGLTFEYCLITAGTSLNRAPSDQVWGAGDIMSIDSGGNYKGYIGDLCRMAIQGEPDSELEDLLGEVDAIQMAARKPIRAGANGGEIYASAGEVLKRSSRANSIEFVAHGMGLISHEAPRLTSHGPIPYPAHDADRPLESGMVISIETTIAHPRRGFIKLEDTVAVTDMAGKPLAIAGGDGIEPAPAPRSDRARRGAVASIRLAQAAGDRAGQSERRSAPERNLRRVRGRPSERDRHQRRPERLADQPSGGLKAGSPAASLPRRAADDHPIVGRLEKPKAEAADRQPPCERGRTGIADAEGDERQPSSHHQKADAAKQAGMNRSARRPAIGAIKAVATGQGVRSSPDVDAEWPSRFSK